MSCVSFLWGTHVVVTSSKYDTNWKWKFVHSVSPFINSVYEIYLWVIIIITYRDVRNNFRLLNAMSMQCLCWSTCTLYVSIPFYWYKKFHACAMHGFNIVLFYTCFNGKSKWMWTDFRKRTTLFYFGILWLCK